ncbi:Riboflavin biosynthesis protein RibBA [Durusdinium trenchii]|uniref:Riboflavin biosynthesis protein RibBA n=1 Tax=Durusdinium trenchii TaxID=1381693 RepID=A0ABP0MJY3_9DINO
MAYAKGSPPSRCAECGNVLVDALVLSCGHDLCLSCAASALRQTRSLSGKTVRCLLCPSITELCDEAAKTLLSRPTVPMVEPQALPLRTPEWPSQASGMNLGVLYPPRIPNERARRDESSPQSLDSGPSRGIPARALVPAPMPTSCVPVPSSAIARRDEEPWPGRTVHIFRCAEHPEEPATYFCATCECQCICADAEPKEADLQDVLEFGDLEDVLEFGDVTDLQDVLESRDVTDLTVTDLAEGHTSREAGVSWSSETDSCDSEVDRTLSMTATVSLSLILKPELLRGTPLSVALSGFCKYWAGLSSGPGRAALFNLSRAVLSIDVFLSHDWETSRWMKLLTLVLYFNSHAAAIASLLSSLVIGVAKTQLGSSIWQHDLWTFSCYPVFLVFLFFWQRIRSCFASPWMVFLDKLCIHQENDELKLLGILGLGAFVRRSNKLLVLWSKRTFGRLWCAYEIGCFLSGRPLEQEQIEILPVTVAAILFLISGLWHVVIFSFIWPRILRKLRLNFGLRYMASLVWVSNLPELSLIIWDISRGPEVPMSGLDYAAWCARLLLHWVILIGALEASMELTLAMTGENSFLLWVPLHTLWPRVFRAAWIFFHRFSTEECVVQKDGRHRDHEVMRVARAHEVLKSRAGALLDEAVALEDDFAMVGDRIAWRRKDIERAAARGRASVRSAFARVRAQLNEREAELLESLDAYETGSLSSLDTGHTEYGVRLTELRRLQENLRARCRNDGDAVEALNTYSAAKAAIASWREAFRQEEFNAAPPDEFVGLAGSARAELDVHAEGLASLEEAVASLCERGVEDRAKASTASSAYGRPPPSAPAAPGPPTFSLRNGGHFPERR